MVIRPEIARKSACEGWFVKAMTEWASSEVDRPDASAMDNGDNEDVIRLFLVKDDMTATFVAAQAWPDPFCGAAYLGMDGKHGETVGHVLLISFGLRKAELFQAVEVYIGQIAVGAI